jgi:hypothetical protein
MEPIAAACLPFAGHGDGIIGIDRLLFGATLPEADSLSVHQIDCGVK